MSEQTKTRYAFDLDDLEKQLRQTAGSQPKVASSDPLADLARIVGQDDPFKAMFADKRSGVAAAPAPVSPGAPVAAPAPAASPVTRRMEPALDDALHSPAPAAGQHGMSPVAAQPDAHKDMLDEFDRLLQGELRGTARPLEAGTLSVGEPIAAGKDGSNDFRQMLSREPAPARASEQSALDIDDFHRRILVDERVPDVGNQPLPTAEYPEPPEDQPADLRSLEPQQPRKGLVIAGVLLGVAALGIGSVVGLRSFSGPVRGTGEVPLIKADAGPAKVAPVNPGGVEIPNQNKQIYERTPEPKANEARVVIREEQPIDVQASARAAARVILPGPGVAAPSATAQASASTTAPMPAAVESTVAANPAAQPSLASASQPPAAALGEPRRVRTVAVRPDGTIAPVNGSPAPASPPASLAAQVAAPPAVARPAAPAATAAPPAPRPPVARAASEEPAAQRPAPPRTQVAAVPATVPAPRAVDAPPAEGGGFMVQLGAPGSEAEARSSFASLQRRYSDQLSGESAVIRRADVGNGRTVYRLRVGPFSREEAAEKCQALQAAGGQCFIARN